MTKLPLTFATVLLAIATLHAQTTPTPPPPPTPGAIAAHPDWPAAKPEDVASVDAIIKALSDSISGPAGQPRDWNRFRSLFVPVAGRLVVVRAPAAGAPDVIILTPDDYIARNAATVQTQGIYEQPLVNQSQNFAEITHVYSSYQLKHSKDDPKPIARGINSYELLHSAGRYYILQVYWTTERPGIPLPTAFEPK